jgi:AraC-like DNA-binding protein
MPSSAIQKFSDAEEYAASIRGAKIALTIIGRGEFDAEITRINFHRLWMQRFSENLPRVMHSANATGRAIISFHTQPGPDLVRSGVDVSPNCIAWLGKDHSYLQRSSGLTNWGAMSLPEEDLRDVWLAISDCDLTPRSDELIVRPLPAAMAKLQRLHAVAGELAERQPDILANAEVARGLEQALIQSWVACVDTGDVVESTAARGRHSAIMQRFHAEIEAHVGEAVYIPEICRATNASQRMLNMCCHEALGMGPKRYLLRRRMQLARQALARAEPARATVTGIATGFGFFDLGRFAVEYRSLFGEPPSATLRAPAV